MSTIINGTDNSATTPAITGSTGGTSTGVFYPASNQLALATNGTTAVTIDTSQNVGIGTASPSYKLDVQNNASAITIRIKNSNSTSKGGIQFDNYVSTGSGSVYYDNTNGVFTLGGNAGVPTVFNAAGTERMRIDSSGNVIVSGTSTSSNDCTYQNGGVFVSRRASSGGTYHAYFYNGGTEVGSITSNTVATFYNTTSDYRLKENATPVTTGLQTITALNPVNFDWISKNVSDTGFLAHEFQAVIPNSVMGTKDAVDANGKPIYQQIDRSGAIPFLVAAIKELKAIADAQAARIAALEAAP